MEMLYHMYMFLTNARTFPGKVDRALHNGEICPTNKRMEGRTGVVLEI